ncbi:MAG: hypothetical protein ACXVIY_04525 [Mucilaginibacter sp.]
MKKVILAAMLLASAGALSSFTIKNDTATVKRTVSDKKDLATADDKKDLATADDKKDLATADAHRRNTTNDKKDLATAD